MDVILVLVLVLVLGFGVTCFVFIIAFRLLVSRAALRQHLGHVKRRSHIRAATSMRTMALLSMARIEHI
jgi:hypothetical protein